MLTWREWLMMAPPLLAVVGVLLVWVYTLEAENVEGGHNDRG